MTRLAQRLGRIGRCEDGVAAIEFCLTLPMLLLMTVGAYDASRLIATRIDYQQAVTEAAGLAIAQPPQSGNLDYLINATATAAGVPASKVTVTRELRCNGTVMPSGSEACASTADERARYVSIGIQTTYEPMWTHFGLPDTVDMRITRTVRYQ